MTQTDYISVPYGKTVHGEEEIAAVVNVLRTSTQMGKNVRQMEDRVAGLYNKKYGSFTYVNSANSYFNVINNLNSIYHIIYLVHNKYYNWI